MIMKTWNEHGTKLLGLLQLAAGAVMGIDPTLLTTLLGPRWAAAVLIVTGLLTVRRGVVNTRQAS